MYQIQRKPVRELLPAVRPLIRVLRDPSPGGVPAGGRHHRPGTQLTSNNTALPVSKPPILINH